MIWLWLLCNHVLETQTLQTLCPFFVFFLFFKKKNKVNIHNIMYITLKYGNEFVEETFSFTTQKGKQMSLKIFCSYSMTLICNANRILLRGKNLLKLQCKVMYLLRDVDLYVLQIIAEDCVFFSQRSLSRVNKCDRRSLFISRLCN